MSFQIQIDKANREAVLVLRVPIPSKTSNDPTIQRDLTERERLGLAFVAWDAELHAAWNAATMPSDAELEAELAVKASEIELKKRNRITVDLNG